MRTLEAAPEADPADFAPAMRRDADELDGFLEFLAAEIVHPGLAAVVTRFFSDDSIARVAAAPPAAETHHSYAGGLLEHTVGVATLCRETAQLHPRLRSDTLARFAALLHDIGRVAELDLRPDLPVRPTKAASSVMSISACGWSRSAATALEAAARSELLHAIACHHDARSARTAEASVLYHANQLDAVAATRPVSQLASRDEADRTRAGREPDVGIRRLLRAAQRADARRAPRPLLRHRSAGSLRSRSSSPSEARARPTPPCSSPFRRRSPGTLGLYAVLPRHGGGRDEHRGADRRHLGGRAGCIRDRDRATGRRPGSGSGSRPRSEASSWPHGSRVARQVSPRASACALLAALGFGGYFPPMHAAGEADFWWASLIFRMTSTAVILAAVAIRRPSLAVQPLRSPDPRADRNRRHARQPSLCGRRRRAAW